MNDLISRQGAIKLLDDMPIAPYAPEDDTYISKWDAIDKISDMLSAEPKDDGNLISRKDAIDTLGYDLWIGTNGVFDSIDDAVEFVKNSLNTLPSAINRI